MKYFLAGLGVILAIILLIVLLVRDRDPQTAEVEQNRTVVLRDYAEKPGTNVEFTQDGPINGNERHRAVRITISANDRIVDVLSGYDGDVIKSQRFPNEINAYKTFLEALTVAGFTKENKEIEFDAPQAVCPESMRYFYEINDGSDEVMDLWSASCRKGSFIGNAATVRNLFRAQIPDYNRFVSDVRFTLN